MKWWAEICPPYGSGVCFAGPTGIYSFVILLTWWCKLLKGKPAGQQQDCLRVLKEVDQALLVAVNNIKNRSAVSISTPSKAPKRSNPEAESSRKRARVESA